MASQLLLLPPKIICHILSYLWDANGYGTNSISLAKLARTCRQLWSPAVAILWQELPAITPLLATLPADLYTLKDVHEEIATLTAPTGQATVIRREVQLLRSPIPEDFERWTAYAQYIRAAGPVAYLWAQPRQLAKISFSPEAWTSLTRYGPIPLLPNVRCLSLGGYETQYLLPDTLLFPLGGSFVHLHLWPTPGETDLREILRRLTTAAPQLEEFIITEHPRIPIQDEHAGIDASLAACLRAMSRLRVLRLHDIPILSSTLFTIGGLHLLEQLSMRVKVSRLDGSADVDVSLAACLRALPSLRKLEIAGVAILPSTLSTIAFLPFLQSLTVEIVSLTYSADCMNDRVPGTFPAIQQLEIRVDDLSWITALLRHVSSSCLECVRITYLGLFIPHGVIDGLYAAIARRHSRLAFRRMMIDCLHEQRPYDITEAVRPLLTLPALIVLCMVGWSSIIVDDRTLDAMAHAWPRLMNLGLGHFSDRSQPRFDDRMAPKATLAGLAPIARRCTNIGNISLAIDTTVKLPAPEDPPPQPVVDPQTRMVTLHVGWTGPPRDPVRIAAFLSEHFPTLYSLGVLPRTEEYEETVAGWDRVMGLVHTFKLIRQQERSWAEQSRRTSRRGTDS